MNNDVDYFRKVSAPQTSFANVDVNIIQRGREKSSETAAEGGHHFPEFRRQSRLQLGNDLRRNTAVETFSDRAGDSRQCICITSQRDGLSDGVLKIGRLKEGCQGFRD